MLLASNRGVGMNIGFPDVCLTPAAPSPIPVPYPNMAMNVQASPFAALVKVTFMPALNMGSKIPMTMGDEGGVAHATFKGMGAYTMGSPIVFIEKLPGIHLVCPTTGNNMNNPVGAVLVPSVTTVFYTCAFDGTSHAAPTLESLDEVTSGATAVACRRLSERVGLLRIASFPRNVRTLVYRALAQLDDVEQLIVDLRGNPGGDAKACLQLAGDFVEDGAELARLRYVDGDERTIHARSRSQNHVPLAIIVDRHTASAAELFAGCLQARRRALVFGEATYGKGSVQRLVPERDGAATYRTVGAHLLPDGRAIEQEGIMPDVAVSSPTLDKLLEAAQTHRATAAA